MNGGLRSLFLHTLLAYLFSCTALPLLNAQIKDPVIDDVPDVYFNEAESEVKYNVRATLYAKEPVQGEIIFNSSPMITLSGDSSRIYRLDSIRQISVTSWSGKRKGGGWLFSPSGYEMILRDGSRVLHKGNIELLNRIRFRKSEGGDRYLYTYYYDYYVKGKWLNTGTAGEGTESSMPAPGALYIIELK